MLEWRLQRTFADREIEVINTALTAVNSYTLLDFADEIVTQRPDAIIIYAGHNEYYGVLGVGSSQAVGTFRGVVSTYVAVRRLRIVQLIRSAYHGVRKLVGASSASSRTPTLMEQMVREREIPYGSALYERGVRQFQRNLHTLLERYQRAGIPVFIGTLVSNERHEPPFISKPHPGTDDEAWQAAL